jgi:hypothetical protein
MANFAFKLKRTYNPELACQATAELSYWSYLDLAAWACPSPGFEHALKINKVTKTADVRACAITGWDVLRLRHSGAAGSHRGRV